MSVVGFDDQNPEACQISIVGHAGANRLPLHKAVINPALGYAMKSIKPLNDRIKRLQKFAVKTSHVSASSGVGNNANNEIAAGGFEKKSGNNFDLKNLNLAACRLCECYNVEEIVTDTDTGLPYDKVCKRGYYTKAQKKFKPFIKDKTSPEEHELNPLAELADLTVHYSWLQVATVAPCPEVLDEDSTLEDIPEEIQNFQYLKFVLANDTNQAKCNIWLDVYKRTLIRMKPTFPTVSIVQPLSIVSQGVHTSLECLKNKGDEQKVPDTRQQGSTFHTPYLYSGRKTSFMGGTRKTSFMTSTAQDSGPSRANISIKVHLGVASSQIITVMYLPILTANPEEKATRGPHESLADGWARMTLMPTIHRCMDNAEEKTRNDSAGRGAKTIYYSRDRNNSRQRLKDLQEEMVRDKRIRSSSRTSRDYTRTSNGGGSRYADESLKRMTSFLDNRMREAAEKNNDNSSRRSYHADSHQENGGGGGGDTRYNRYSTGSRYESAMVSGGGAGHQSRFESTNSNSSSRYESGSSRLDSAISRYNSSSVARFEPSSSSSSSASNPRYDSSSNGTATSRFESGGSSGSRFDSGVSRYDSGGSRFQSSKIGMSALGRTSSSFYKGKR